ncbi:sensor histidine kinase [Rubellimicrobium roseum]|nr:ATP-binding protein [Rubellimicrobium roseum]
MDIVDDDLRASGIIAQLRRMMVRGPTEFEDLDLNEAVRYTTRLIHSELVARHTALDLRLGPQKLMVRGNEPQLQQIVLNLLLNAVEAMGDLPPDRRRILIETELGDDGSARLGIRDFGHGLKDEELAKVFHPFHSTKPGGLGLGLSICRMIAEAHGGRLAFDPGVRDGARIVLTLPGPSGGPRP